MVFNLYPLVSQIQRSLFPEVTQGMAVGWCARAATWLGGVCVYVTQHHRASPSLGPVGSLTSPNPSLPMCLGWGRGCPGEWEDWLQGHVAPGGSVVPAWDCGKLLLLSVALFVKLR